MHDGAHYKQVLLREFAGRCRRNPRYSLRAFARDLQIAPSRLSEVFKGKQGLSSVRAKAIAERLGFAKEEAQEFVTLVAKEHSRSLAGKQAAEEELSKNSQYRSLKESDFSPISDWYCLAILELVTLQHFDHKVESVARRLGISIAEAMLAIDNLERIGLLNRKKGRLYAATTFPASPQGIPSAAVKRFHTQILEKAGQALYLQAIEEREFSANVMAIDPSDLPQIKEEMKKFRRGLEKKYKRRPHKEAVYCLGMQFFALTQKEKS